MKPNDIYERIPTPGERFSRAMGKLFFLTAIFAVLSCCTVTYVHNSPVPLRKEDFAAQKHIGIAVFGDAIPDLKADIEGQINEFAGQPMQFRDIESETTLNPDRTMIEEMEGLAGNNPDMPYAFIVWLHPSQAKYKTEPGEETYTEYRGGVAVTMKKDYTLYTTILSVQCEVMLFDLKAKTLIAKSVDTFRNERSNRHYHTFPGHTFLGELTAGWELFEWVLGSQDTPSPRHPQITGFDKRSIPGDYFRRFLERIGKKNHKTGAADDER